MEGDVELMQDGQIRIGQAVKEVGGKSTQEENKKVLQVLEGK